MGRGFSAAGGTDDHGEPLNLPRTCSPLTPPTLHLAQLLPAGLHRAAFSEPTPEQFLPTGHN